ncbi:GRF zinc finger containing protein [Striga asiatica]|uniref:GRF zinc finger containing protein n=1 Tax=Striga asiatica TaxID=4170 RepID=A0A5A7RI51_STRAF|nr:GRF zinc finger containing protein [Striga asiatica]
MSLWSEDGDSDNVEGRQPWAAIPVMLELRGCDFFDWYDPPMCRRSKIIIPGLLRKMNEREVEIKKLKLKNEHLVKLDKKLKKIVCILVLLLVFTILSKFKVGKENPSGMNQVKML